MTHTVRKRPLSIIAALAMFVLMAGSVMAANPNSTTTSTGQGFEVEITLDPAGPVLVGETVEASSLATLGTAPPSPVNFMYVVDVSGSMVNDSFNPFQPELVGDCDGDGLEGTAMDAACEGLISLNESLGDASSIRVGLVAFGRGAVTADVDPAPGEQIFTSPPDVDNSGSGTPDMEQVIRSLHVDFDSGEAGVGLFTDKISDGFARGTYYDDALQEMNAAFATLPSDETNIAQFISDGEPSSGQFTTGAGSPLAEAVAAGTRINTFAIGTIAPGSCALGEPLRIIADETGGVCTEVEDPSTLGVTFTDVLNTQITTLDLRVNGALVTDTSGSEPAMMSIGATDITSFLSLGVNTVESTATAADGSTVTASVEIEVIEEADPQPVVTVTKSGPDTAEVGEAIVYDIEICNAGEGDVDLLSVTDDVLGSLAAPATLAEGACESFDPAYVVDADDIDDGSDPPTITNTVTVSWQSQLNGFEPDESQASHVLTVIVVEVDDPVLGEAGCTPGFWRQPHHFEFWTGAGPDDSFATTFGITEDFELRGRGRTTFDQGEATLLHAVEANGGGINALARHAVAALLNANSPDVEYPYAAGDIIDWVKAAIEGGDRSAMNALKNQLEAANELGCTVDKSNGNG